MGVRSTLAEQIGPAMKDLAPSLTHSFVREALERAIHGVGPLTGAAKHAQGRLTEHEGDRERAVASIVDNHARLAGAQGFLTNLGGAVTATVTIPANITGLALVQSRMIAAIVHLRGYELDDPRVRNAILVTLLGEERIETLVTDLAIPAPPMALATAPAHDSAIDIVVTAEVAAEMVARIAGKRMAGVVGRRIPLVGGFVGLGVDGLATWRLGRFAEREFLPRHRPAPKTP